MKTRKILTALGLAIALTSAKQETCYAYSDKKLDIVEENIEDYIEEKLKQKKRYLLMKKKEFIGKVIIDIVVFKNLLQVYLQSIITI